MDWNALHNIPVTLITGTNGKSTSGRMLAAIVSADGKTPGLTSTDCIQVGTDILDTGDYSGPGGALAVLSDKRVEFGVLESARGGILRGRAFGRIRCLESRRPSRCQIYHSPTS
ncbi:MAG TPA: hypothetical protein EYN85_00005 [Candidatus Lambdaproteobacteria bacterium]|nr:hypothetical protein [Candidatus Lambdaproteobacteria bacterium]